MIEIPDILYPLFLEHPAVSTDSRHIQPGSLFIALKGDSFNGNEFATRALAEGAAYAIVDEAKYAVDERFILVRDGLSTLQSLAGYHRLQFDIPVIAITGSNGKTTTKELVLDVLSKKFRTLATRGNLNNNIGVPLTLLQITSETELAVIEMGANHPGEIDLLCKIARPGYGLITNIGKAHLDGFGGYEGVIKAKTELYRFLQSVNGKVFLNTDDELLKKHATGLDVINYGSFPAEIVPSCLTADPFVAMEIQPRDQRKFKIKSQLYGRYNVDNVLAAVCIGHYFGVSNQQIRTAIKDYRPDNNRSQIVRTKRNLLILDAYNANPSSMEAAIRNFAGSDYPQKTVILGDMLELGAESDKEHLFILDLINHMPLRHIYLVGPVFTKLNKKREFICFQDSDLARIWFEHHQIENSTVLIKGSRGIHLEKLVEFL